MNNNAGQNCREYPSPLPSRTGCKWTMSHSRLMWSLLEALQSGNGQPLQCGVQPSLASTLDASTDTSPSWRQRIAEQSRVMELVGSEATKNNCKDWSNFLQSSLAIMAGHPVPLPAWLPHLPNEESMWTRKMEIDHLRSRLNFLLTVDRLHYMIAQMHAAWKGASNG